MGVSVKVLRECHFMLHEIMEVLTNSKKTMKHIGWSERHYKNRGDIIGSFGFGEDWLHSRCPHCGRIGYHLPCCPLYDIREAHFGFIW